MARTRKWHICHGASTLRRGGGLGAAYPIRAPQLCSNLLFSSGNDSDYDRRRANGGREAEGRYLRAGAPDQPARTARRRRAGLASRDSGNHGRISGLPRQIPVFDGLQGDVFWIVAHHGRSAAYVRNLVANPRVRVKVRGRWRVGSATLVPDDDPLDRAASIDRRASGTARQMGTDLLTIRVDLEQ